MEQTTTTILTNMCMVCDGEYILVLDKENSSYTGVTFPGGHIENGESVTESVIREVKEETGLLVQNPRLCGIYDWVMEEGIRYLVFIYVADEFTGELVSSTEGRVRWIKKETFLDEKVAHGMDKVFEIACGMEYTECYYDMVEKVEYLR